MEALAVPAHSLYHITMLGYVKPYKPDLKVREYEIYSGYYCGVCKYIGATYGQLPRMVLSYDAAFLALLLASVSDAQDVPTRERCIAHHIRKKTIVRNKSIEYAGDLMLILAWFKLIDDIQDENKFSAKSTKTFFGGIYKKLSARHPRLCEGIDFGLSELNALERRGCDSFDKVAEAFAKIMSVILVEGLRYIYGESSEIFGNFHETFANLGYHMGKWIYLIDAADDVEKDIEDGTYNPLLIRFGYRADDNASDESPAQFRARIDEDLRFSLYQYLAVLGECVDKLEFKKNEGIIKNIIYFGMNRRTEEVLERRKDKENYESI